MLQKTSVLVPHCIHLTPLQENRRRKLNGLEQISFPAFVLNSIVGNKDSKQASKRDLTAVQNKVLKWCRTVHLLREEVRVCERMAGTVVLI